MTPRSASDPYGFDSVDPAALRAARSRKWNKFEADVLPAWIADMDYPLAPPISAALRKFDAQGVHGYPNLDITDDFVDSFCTRTNRLFGIGAQPELVKPVTDIVQALYATVFGLTTPSESVLLLTPLYPPFAASVSINGRRIVEHRMAPDSNGVWQFDPEKLRALVKAERPKLFMLCSPHNPVGRLWERSELEFFVSLAVEFDMIVVADEIHADLIFCDRPMIGFASLSDEVKSRTVTVTSANKPFNLAGLKVSQICFGSPELQAQFDRAIPGQLLGAVPTAGMVATTAAYREGQPWLDATCAYLRGNISAFANAMAERVPLVRVVQPEATYLSWLDFSRVAGVCDALGVAKISVGERLAVEGRVGFNEGQTFGDGLEHFARANLATSRSLVLEMVERIGRWVDAQQVKPN
jgi:cysteine-S-conjugate beta-lyase